MRLEIFLENKESIEAHNQLFDNGEVSYAMRLNEFSDLRSSEVAKLRNTYRTRQTDTAERYNN